MNPSHNSLAAAAAATAALGFITSVLVMRGTDLTRLLMTLGIALMLGEIANKQGQTVQVVGQLMAEKQVARAQPGVHARAGRNDFPRPESGMQPAEIGGQRLAQFGNAEVMGVEGFAG